MLDLVLMNLKKESTVKPSEHKES